MDIQILLWLQGIRTDGLDFFFQVCTLLAEDKNFFLVLALVYWCIDKKTGRFMGFVLTYSGLLATFVKGMAEIPRPWLLDKRVQPVASAKAGATGFSFPSGHTSQGMSIYGGSVWKKRTRKWLDATAIIIVVLIGFSRLYLGVHTLKDVLAAVLIVMFTFVMVDRILCWVEKQKNNDILLFFVTGILCILFLFIVYKKPYDHTNEYIVEAMKSTYMDLFKKITMLLSSLLAFLLDRRKIHYKIPSGIIYKSIMYIAGALGIVFLTRYAQDGIKQIFVDCIGSYWGKIGARSFVNGIVVLFIFAVYPWVIQIFEVIKEKVYEKQN